MATTSNADGRSSPRDRSRSPVPPPSTPINVEPDNYSTIRCDTWSLAPAAPGAVNSSKVVCRSIFKDEHSKRRPSFVLLTGVEKQTPYVAFGLDLDPMKGKPDFLREGYDHSAAQTSDGLDLILSVSPELKTFASEKIDTWAKNIAQKESIGLFGKALDQAAIEKVYLPWLREGRENKNGGFYDPTLKVRLILTGPDWNLTRLSIRDPAGVTYHGKGWPFLEKHMGPTRLRKFHACVTVEASTFWVASKGRSFGVQFKAIEAILFYPITDIDTHLQTDIQKLDILSQQLVEEMSS